ncbi:MAG: AAA family ATPase [Candidatus Ancillula sp.]|jgi:predicted AAA+ superfamily ATPase|nr:AAA family ATPase [Candidatus Ancillula sp.]
MRRDLMTKLVEWKNSNNRKPLILGGARQVGKTWLMKEFGKQEYENVAYVNFEDNENLSQLFNNGYNVKLAIEWISAQTGEDINPGKTLIILDEIQAFPKTLTSLKYFNENAPEYHVIAAGSLLGVSFHQGVSFPVGKVNRLTLEPLSFCEFLRAFGEDKLVEQMEANNLQLVTMFRNTLENYLKKYYLIGGMPAAVMTYLNTKSWRQTKNAQKELLNDYLNDFSKYADITTTKRINLVWENIPNQLAKENRKFVFGALKGGARASEFELAIQWLSDAGLIRVVNRVGKPSLPLVGYQKMNSFKIYLLDIGLLSYMSNLDESIVLEKNDIFTEFKGALTEQFVCQELHAGGLDELFYWSNDNHQGEIDFLMQLHGSIVPIEVKAEENLQAKSLKAFRDKFHPPVSVRTSLSDYRDEGWLVNIPLYMISQIEKLLEGREG